jgi:hypothetical protein
MGNNSVPEFNSLPIGTHVVFHISGVYQSETHVFGLVIKDRRRKNKFQEVESNQEKGYMVTVIPYWNKPIPQHIYNVVVNHRKYKKGAQYLEGYTQFPIFKTMLYVALFKGIYDEKNTYLNHYYTQ